MPPEFCQLFGATIIGATVEVAVGESDILQGIYFQDKEMKDIFVAYPEFVCIDATYKLL